ERLLDAGPAGRRRDGPHHDDPGQERGSGRDGGRPAGLAAPFGLPAELPLALHPRAGVGRPLGHFSSGAPAAPVSQRCSMAASSPEALSSLSAWSTQGTSGLPFS